MDGKFLQSNGKRLLLKGVAYGTFAPDERGDQFPAAPQVAADFAQMQHAGINTVRLYTVPQPSLLDEAARHDLRVMVGVPWSQHIAFLDDRRLARQIRKDAAASVRALGAHPAALLFALGNEIPPAVVRWYGPARIERFLRELYDEVKDASPESLLTYVNFPPTEHLDVECYDVCSFNVYLHREPELRRYLARLQQIAGGKPLLLAEAGADSIREGGDGQAAITAMHLRAAFEEGLCGAVAFSWTDEWWRGGHDVDDWAFGLVDRARQPKPALAAVAQAFADAPFSEEAKRQWPSVSVVVCAYNAADTLDDCLSSLQTLTYPNAEIIVVNDGSRDATGEIAHRYAARSANVRVIDIPNGGLSAARNVGLAEATGEIVAYTDADVRVDPDWLSYLVQPFVTSDVVGSGGPNVVPVDDPWVAQCVARSPGGPTQVLLTDRIAEHVPGCNMAFRRQALLAIGGFNPVYLRAGDDVDVCWRLQAKGQTIGFSPSALVWHHHRPSVKAYWRQQVGYGEGETWLDAHHPEKFVAGNMIWRGRIYSPLPFVRSLSGRRVNTGVWGTAAFPSVYRTDVNAAQFLPHSPIWLAIATLVSIAGGAAALLSPFMGAAALLLALGVLGWGTTVLRCIRFGFQSDLSGLRGRTSVIARTRYRLLIAALHFLQPLARFYGRIRGMMSPPLVVEPERVTRFPWKAQVSALRDSAAATLLLGGGRTEEAFWGETWTSHDGLLTEITGLLRAVRPTRHVDVDDGWHPDRDVSVALGKWGWLDQRAFIEEHGGSKVLLRVTTRLRPALRGIVIALSLTTLSVVTATAAIALRWPWLSAACVAIAGFALVRALWQAATGVAVVRQATLRATSALGMVPMAVRGSESSRRLRTRPASARQAFQGMVTAALVASVTVTGSSLAGDLVERATALPAVIEEPEPPEPAVDSAGALEVAPNGDLLLADTGMGVIRRLDTRTLNRSFRATSSSVILGDLDPREADLAFASAADVAIAGNGDLYVADARNHRICRIERRSGKIITVAGYGLGGFDSDDVQATQTALNRPHAVAVALNGDLYIADTFNHRVRVITQATGVIRTIAGDGTPGDGELLGDGGPATSARLNRPTDVALAPNGDIYIADMGHNRIRVVDANTGIISTVAGDGRTGGQGDGGPARSASLGAPTSLALVPKGRQMTIFIAEYLNGSVRVVNHNGVISTLGEPGRFKAPSRLAYRTGGWLYVASERGAITAINVEKGHPYQIATVARRARKQI